MASDRKVPPWGSGKPKEPQAPQAPEPPHDAAPVSPEAGAEEAAKPRMGIGTILLIAGVVFALGFAVWDFFDFGSTAPPPEQRDVYARREECEQDWGAGDKCEPVRDGEHAGRFYGPHYFPYLGGYGMGLGRSSLGQAAAPGAGLAPGGGMATGTVPGSAPGAGLAPRTGMGTATGGGSHAMSSVHVSRGGFGGSGSHFSSGS